MPTPYVGRLDEIGIAKESASGTAIAMTNGVWLPVMDPTYSAKAEQDFVPGGQGTIDDTEQGYVTRLTTDVQLKGSPTDKRFGHLMHALFGTSTPCVKYTLASIVGTFVEGETVTEATTSATGVIKRLDAGAGTPAMYLSIVSGTFGTAHTLTGGTSGATATGTLVETVASGVRFHVFRRNNTNQHPSYTIYNHSPLVDERASYCMLDTLDIEAVNGKIVSYDAKFVGKMFATASAQTPSYTTENDFVGKRGTAKTAAAFNSLDAATAIDILSMKLSFTKKVEVIQSVNQTNGTDVASIHNTEFGLTGSFVLKYDAVTYRDLFTAGTNQAIRLTLTASPTIGSASNPTIQFDIPAALLTDVSIPRTQGEIVKQTISFRAQRDATRGFSVEGLLIAANTTAY